MYYWYPTYTTTATTSGTTSWQIGAYVERAVTPPPEPEPEPEPCTEDELIEFIKGKES